MSTHHSLLPTTMTQTQVQSRATLLTPPSAPARIRIDSPGRKRRWWSRRESGVAPRLSRADQDPGLAATRLFLGLR